LATTFAIVSAAAFAPALVATPAVTVVTSRTTVTVPARSVTTVAAGARLDDRLELTLDGQQLEQVASLLLASVHHVQHGDPVDLLLDLDLQLVPDRGAGRQDPPVEHTLGLLRPGRAPGPSAVAERAGEFDV